MQPPIQYVRSADGVTVGYWTVGVGRTLVYVTNLGFAGTVGRARQLVEGASEPRASRK
jgi:hypothetical protein